MMPFHVSLDVISPHRAKGAFLAEELAITDIVNAGQMALENRSTTKGQTAFGTAKGPHFVIFAHVQR